MAFRYDVYHRLEPQQPFENLQRGFRAEIHDPVWFLGRQWQLGEHRGEDASSPVKVSYRASDQPIDPYNGDPLMDPKISLPEAIIESEPGDWWTPGRRIRIGKEVSAGLPALALADPDLLLADLPFPYHRFNGLGYDGQKLYQHQLELSLDPSLFAEVPITEPQDLWDPAEFYYSANFTCAGKNLAIARHFGGHVDWYSVDADGPLPQVSPANIPDPIEVYPNRLNYPGAPNLRWWEIENHTVDIGGFPPDRTHFATMLLIDVIVSHSDDWFTFPIASSAGNIVTLYEVVIKDSFGDRWTIIPPSNWSMFKVKGLRNTSLVLWPTVPTPLTGSPLEDVVIGIDEDANLLWAVERRINGRDVPTPNLGTPTADTTNDSGQVLVSGRPEYIYHPSAPVFPHWHPYQIQQIAGRRRFVQGRLADLNQSPPILTPEPIAKVLYDPGAVEDEPVHQIEPSTVPVSGIRLERRWILGRRTDGLPALWMQRQRLPLRTPPALKLRFDIFEEKLPIVKEGPN